MKQVYVTFVGEDYKWPIAVGYLPRTDGDVCFIEKAAYDLLEKKLKEIEAKEKEVENEN